MKYATFSLPLLLSALMLAMTLSLPAQARQELTTSTTDGKPLFLLDIFDKGEVYNPYDEASAPGSGTSTWTLGAREFPALINSSDYWAALLKPDIRNSSALWLVVGTFSEDNDTAVSEVLDSGPYAGSTALMAGLLFDYRDPDGDPLGMIQIGYSMGAPGNDDYGPMQVLSHNGLPSSLANSLTHELGHALGMLSNAKGDVGEAEGAAFDSQLSRWDGWLYDAFGTRAQAGMEILDGDVHVPGAFVVDASGANHAYFRGPQTMRVLGGALLDSNGLTGMPIQGLEDDEPDFSHPQIQNSMMSHLNYRNWVGYMEAELAMLNDIGYNIDLKDFYGLSIYDTGDGISTFHNHNGYFARNPAGNGYLPGTYNASPLGIGLHIFGARNRIVQMADILSSGFGGAGIRMDGSGFIADGAGGFDPVYGQNHLTVAPGVKVHAHGELGSGLMVTYGQDQIVVNQGEIAALGKGGVGVRLDFGDNILGNAAYEYRGSYIYTDTYGGAHESWADLVYEGLNGPLVSRFDLTGTMAGSAAALFISENAMVEEINIMQGAQIFGDIISRWDPDSPMIHPNAPALAPSRLTFGYSADAGGEILPAMIPDSAFALRYRGDISGRKGLDVEVAGGVLDYSGRVDVRSFELLPATTLKIGLLDGVAPTLIGAESISLKSGSIVGFSQQGMLYGGSANTKEITILRMEASLFDNSSSLLQSQGVLLLGPYDYFYNGLYWKSPEELALSLNGRQFNRERAGTSAVTAPLAMSVHNQGLRTVRRHSTQLFARRLLERSKVAAPALNFLGGNIQGSSLSSYGPAFIRDGSGRKLSGQEHAGALHAGRDRVAFQDQERLLATRFTGSRNQVPQWFGTADGGGTLGTSSFSLWATPGYNYTHQSGYSHYDIYGPNLAFGGDGWFGERFFAGLAAALDFPEYDAKNVDIDARNITGILYAGVILPWNLELGASLAYGQTSYDQTRTVMGRQYDSDYDSCAWQMGLSLGRSFSPSRSLALRPFVSYEYLHLETDDYTEKSGDMSLRFSPEDNELHRLEAGLDAAWTFENGAYLTGGAYYAGLHGDTRARSRTTFSADAAQNRFITRGDALDKDSLGLGLGGGLPLSERLELAGAYNFLGGKNSATHQGTLGLTFKF